MANEDTGGDKKKRFCNVILVFRQCALDGMYSVRMRMTFNELRSFSLDVPL